MKNLDKSELSALADMLFEVGARMKIVASSMLADEELPEAVPRRKMSRSPRNPSASTRYTEEDKKTMAEMFKSGRPDDYIAKSLGRTRAAITRQRQLFINGQ